MKHLKERMCPLLRQFLLNKKNYRRFILRASQKECSGVWSDHPSHEIESISEAFNFHKTDEGHDFWNILNREFETVIEVVN